ncbi:MAG: hypothetical protein ACRDI1_12125, partial [Actinomycetota bacterium]
MTRTFNPGAAVRSASTTDPALVPSAIAEALGVQEVPGRPILQDIQEHLSPKEMLLTIDNFEQV